MNFVNMRVKFFLLLGIVPCVTALSLHEVNTEWSRFQLMYNRTFVSKDEEYQRYAVFTENLDRIHRHNMAADKGHYSYWLGINKFADLTDDEFEELFTGLRTKAMLGRHGGLRQQPTTSFNLSSLPKEIDWRNKKCVTKVKFQGICGSCYAFAATGALEGQHCIKTGKLVSLSEQNIIDCTDNNLFWNEGCKGGQANNAFQYVIDNGGVDTEESYPYSGEVGKCKFNKETVGATAKDYEDVPIGNEGALMNAVAGVGPIAVCIDTRGLKSYKTGVYDGKYEEADGSVHTCSRKDLNHAMLLVGYGTAPDGKGYWLIKNSWGQDWGLEGYMMLIKNFRNTCGIATLASFPII